MYVVLGFLDTKCNSNLKGNVCKCKDWFSKDKRAKDINLTEK